MKEYNTPIKRHYIYALIDPRTSARKYVGRTCDLARRQSQHCNPEYRERDQAGYLRPNRKVMWIMELRAAGLRPEMYVLETVDPVVGDTSDTLDSRVNEREVYWRALLTRTARYLQPGEDVFQQ